MHSDDYKQTSAILRTRLERLLSERELRKSFRSQHEGLDSIIGNGQIGTDNFTHEEELGKRPAPIRQRLLVVANRLPVRATRKGESSWQLEMSIGGLVSALLGKLFNFLLYSFKIQQHTFISRFLYIFILKVSHINKIKILYTDKGVVKGAAFIMGQNGSCIKAIFVN